MNFRLVVTVIFTLLFIADIEAVSAGVLTALKLCADSIVPSLLIFFIMSELIVKSVLSTEKGLISPKWTVFLLGSICGFPVGASVSDSFVNSGRLDKTTALKLLPFCNNTSPAFVIGAIGVSLFNNKELGVLLYVAEIISAFILVLFIKCDKIGVANTSEKNGFFDDFLSSIEKSVKTILKICVIICFFSAILAFVKNNFGEKTYSILSFLLEIGNGSYICSKTFYLQSYSCIALLGFMCGWSGICVHLQILSAAKSIKVKYHTIVMGKLLHGIFSSVLAVIGYKLLFYS